MEELSRFTFYSPEQNLEFRFVLMEFLFLLLLILKSRDDQYFLICLNLPFAEFYASQKEYRLDFCSRNFSGRKSQRKVKT